jgi:hypothetical protein
MMLAPEGFGIHSIGRTALAILTVRFPEKVRQKYVDEDPMASLESKVSQTVKNCD